MIKALLEFKQELNLSSYVYYKCINPMDSASYAAIAGSNGNACYLTASPAYWVNVNTRQIIKVRKC